MEGRVKVRCQQQQKGQVRDHFNQRVHARAHTHTHTLCSYAEEVIWPLMGSMRNDLTGGRLSNVNMSQHYVEIRVDRWSVHEGSCIPSKALTNSTQ